MGIAKCKECEYEIKSTQARHKELKNPQNYELKKEDCYIMEDKNILVNFRFSRR